MCSGVLSELTFRGNPTNNEILETNHSDFKVTVASDGRYLLDLQGVDGGVQYYAFDGTDTFIVKYWKGSLVNTNPQTLNGQRIPICFISAGCFPYDNRTYRGGALWCVFGSGSFFHTNLASSDYPIPILASRINASAYGYRFEAKVENRAPFLPTEIVYYTDLKSELPIDAPLTNPHLNAPTDPSNPEEYQDEIRRQKRKYPKDNFRVADLISRDFTNVAGMTVPQHFKMRIFHPHWPTVPLMVIAGNVSQFKPTMADNNFRPPVRAVIDVSDERFRWRDKSATVDNITYPMTPKDKWRSSTDPHLVAMFQQEIGYPQSTLNVSRRKVVVICFMFVVFIALPLWLAWSKWFKKDRS